MHVELHETLTGSKQAQLAVDLTRACVHCGFCLESCPTYLDGRDERDSPRGWIYLIKQVLESGAAGSSTQTAKTCRKRKFLRGSSLVTLIDGALDVGKKKRGA